VDRVGVKLSVVIPAHDEAESIGLTLDSLIAELQRHEIDYEIVVVDDASSDGTGDVVRAIGDRDPRVRCLRSSLPPGFGYAVRFGLEAYTGDAVAIMMADLSDAPEDLITYYRVLEQGYDCAFGTRFDHGGLTYDYPLFKLVLNRMANVFIRALFRHGYSDTTNAFKAYRRYVIDQAQPLLSNHFNLTVELPLKAVARGYDFGVVPISWTNRRFGASKLKIQEMGSRYAFIVLYVWLEQLLSRGDYVRKDLDRDAPRATRDRWVQTGSSPADRSRTGERRGARRLARR
jgi:dolichol-phosphate mannosyltransferase